MDPPAQTDLPATWSRQLGWAAVVLLVYAAAVLLAEWRFIPLAGTTFFDLRSFACCIHNRAHEIDYAAGGVLQQALGAISGLRPWAGGPGGYNIFPQLLIWLLLGLFPLVQAANLAVLLVWVANCAGVYCLARRLGADRGGAMLAGGLFGLSPQIWRLIRFDNLSYGAVFWVPLLVAALLRAREPRGRWAMVAVGVCTLGLGLTNYYYLLMAVFFGACLLLDALLPGGGGGGPGRGRAPLRGLLLSAGAAALALLPLLRVELAPLLQGRGAYDSGFNVGHQAGLITIDQALQQLGLLSPWWLTLVLMVPLSLALRRSRPGRRDTVVLVSAALAGLLALGLYGYLAGHRPDLLQNLPLLRRLGRYTQMSVCTLALLCAAAGRGFTVLQLVDLRRSLRVAITVGALLLVGLGLIWARAEVDRVPRGHPSFAIPEQLFGAVAAAGPGVGIILVDTYRDTPAGQLARLYFWDRSDGNTPVVWDSDEARTLRAEVLGQAGLSAAALAKARAWLVHDCELLLVHLKPRQRTRARQLITGQLGLKLLWSGQRWLLARDPVCAGRTTRTRPSPAALSPPTR